MKVSRLFPICVVVNNLLAFTQPTFSQGTLSPTGPPAPTMKTLSQVEPRTPISALPATITTSGSYYLTTNLTCTACSNGVNGININVAPLPENVTVDLNGFTLTGTNGSGNGISCGNQGHNYVIRNGTLRNWGTDGVNAFGAINSRFEHLQLYENANIGLQAGVGCVVAECQAYSNAAAGLQLAGAGGEIGHCVAAGNSGMGIVASAGCVVADCTAFGNSSDGINGGAGTLIGSCASYQNGGTGVNTSSNCTVRDCTVSANTTGIGVGINCTVVSCTVNGNNGDGVFGGNNGAAVLDCTASGNFRYGINLQNNCTIKNCTANGNNIGILVANNCTVKDCTANGNIQDGITFTSDCQITGNTCSGNGLVGINTSGIQNRIDNNNVPQNGSYGIFTFSANVGNSITRNSAPGNGTNYSGYAGNNDYAPTGMPSTATSPWTNF